MLKSVVAMRKDDKKKKPIRDLKLSKGKGAEEPVRYDRFVSQPEDFIITTPPTPSPSR
jgi:hypothetical protein